jgi:hypothetical protein
MAELTNLETKLAEVIGLAMAAQDLGDRASSLAKKEKRTDLVRTLAKMKREAAEAEREGTQVAGALDGKKTAILKEARATKAKAGKMASTYLDRSADALDAFEFMTMAEAGEVGHWSVLGELNRKANDPRIRALVRKHGPIQKRHLQEAQRGALQLAADENPNEAA